MVPRWVRWAVGILISPALMVGLILWVMQLTWNHFHPEHESRVAVVDWWPTDESTDRAGVLQPATAHVRVHNDGDTSAEGCRIHWVLDPLTALIENPRLCSPKFLTCEQRSV